MGAKCGLEERDPRPPTKPFDWRAPPIGEGLRGSGLFRPRQAEVAILPSPGWTLQLSLLLELAGQASRRKRNVWRWGAPLYSNHNGRPCQGIMERGER